MRLDLILLVTVSILTFLSGVAVLSGVRKGERTQGFLYFLISFFAVFWAIGIGVFLSLGEETSAEVTRFWAYIIYLPALIMSWGLASYQGYKYKLGRVMMGVFGVWGLVLFVLPIINSGVLYSTIEINATSGNVVHLQHNFYNWAYMAYFILTCMSYMLAFLHQGMTTKNIMRKRANFISLAGFTLTGVVALAFDVILSYLGKYDTIWAGPLAMSLCWLLHYYAIIKYRLLDLSGRWLKLFSYVIVLSFVALGYLTIFFAVFLALFKVGRPSADVVVLNMIMIGVIVFLFPTIYEIISYFRSLSLTDGVDLVYLVRKLKMIGQGYVNYNELANFLAEHLHFLYVGIVTDEKVFGSENGRSVNLSPSLVTEVTKLKNKNKDVWIEMPEGLKTELRKAGVEAVVEVRNTKGEPVGKILLGRPLGGVNLSARNLNELEIAFELVGGVLR